MLHLIHCLREAEKRKRGGVSKRRNETESRSRNKDAALGEKMKGGMTWGNVFKMPLLTFVKTKHTRKL